MPVFCAITTAGWSFFGIFYLLRSAHHTALICFPEAIVMLGLFYHTLRKPESRKSLANAHIFVSFVGLGAEILISGLSNSTTLLFLSCLIVIAAHQSGFREAFVWTLICSVFVLAIHFLLEPSEWPILRRSSLLDSATAFIGFYVLIMWMASHTEWYATKYFIRLTDNAKRLEYVAQHDQLTRLANRHSFQIELAEAEAWSLENDQPFGLLALDLNSFKDINDSLGHMAGDIVLQEFAIRLNRAVENQHTVFRVGGDEFAIIVRDATRKLMRDIAKLIQQELIAHISVAGRRLPITTSVGAALFPEHTENTTELQSCAD
ncbi:MAG: GGDEF domain-containing protein, partial [Planctomycetota bacterium]